MAAAAAFATTATTAPWWPTRKWWAATILAVGGLLTTMGSEGWRWSNTASVALIALVTQRAVAYLVPNQDTPGGVPTGERSQS